MGRGDNKRGPKMRRRKSQAKLKAALDKVKAAGQQERDAFAKELADRLNIDVQKVEDALTDLRPPRFGGRHHP